MTSLSDTYFIEGYGWNGAPESTIVPGNLGDAVVQRSPVDRAWLHPELDIVLLEAQELLAQNLSSEPLSPARVVFDDAWVGSPVELAGYGVTETGELGSLQFVIEEVVRVEPDHLVVDGGGRTGACAGDSGGPLLGRDDGGALRVLGILDGGQSSCTGEDDYTRVDRLFDWPPLQEHVLSYLDHGPVSCEGLDQEGLCLRGKAFRCDGEEPTVEDCAGLGLVCGWEPSAGGFRCVREDEDRCAGLGSFARCDAGAVLHCARGRRTRAPCDACQTCIPWLDQAGAGCR
jgi:hypothetical protein